jgi:hypothetical protein
MTTLRSTLGVMLVASPFVLMTLAMIHTMGIKDALVVWSLTVAIVLSITAGLFLLVAP